MNLEFDFDNVEITEFGIGLDDVDDQDFCCMAVDDEVQSALREMAQTTWKSMCESTSEPPLYDPSEKYESFEYVHLPLDNELANRMRELHNADDLPMNSAALSDPTKIFCYFARMTDAEERRLTALHRATQFKGVLKSRLIFQRLITDALKFVEDNVFKLDKDFDLLIDASYVHILRPSAFEFAGNLQGAVLAAVPEHIRLIQSELEFVDLSSVQNYAIKHPRAARYLASIRCQNQAQNVDRLALD